MTGKVYIRVTFVTFFQAQIPVPTVSFQGWDQNRFIILGSFTVNCRFKNQYIHFGVSALCRSPQDDIVRDGSLGHMVLGLRRSQKSLFPGEVAGKSQPQELAVSSGPLTRQEVEHPSLQLPMAGSTCSESSQVRGKDCPRPINHQAWGLPWSVAAPSVSPQSTISENSQASGC